MWSSLRCLLPSPETSPRGKESLSCKPSLHSQGLRSYVRPPHPHTPEKSPHSWALRLSVWWREVSDTFLGPQFPFLLSSPVNSFCWTPSSIIHLPTPLPGASSVTSPSFHQWTLSVEEEELPSLPRNSCFPPCITHLSRMREHRDLAPRTK